MADSLIAMDYNTATQTYDRVAPVYHFMYNHHEIDAIDFVNKMELQAGESLLDLGTGTGLVALYALQQGCSFVLGVDASQQCLFRATLAAQQILQVDASRYDFMQCDMTDPAALCNAILSRPRPPVVAGTKFDKIAMLWSLDHVDPARQQNWLRMLGEQFLKPNGIIILTKNDPRLHMQTIEVVTGWHNPTLNVINAPIAVHMKRWVGDRAAFLRARNDVRALAQSAGFSVKLTTPCPHREEGEYEDYTTEITG